MRLMRVAAQLILLIEQRNRMAPYNAKTPHKLQAACDSDMGLYLRVLLGGILWGIVTYDVCRGLGIWLEPNPYNHNTLAKLFRRKRRIISQFPLLNYQRLSITMLRLRSISNGINSSRTRISTPYLGV